MLSAMTAETNWPVCWANAKLRRLGQVDALLLAQQLCEDGFLLYSNAHRFRNDPGVMQGIWDLRDSVKSTGRMLVLLASPGATLPQELGQDVLILDEPLPATSHLEQIVRETFNAANLSEPGRPVIVMVVDALIGLAAFPAEQALAISLVKRQLNTEDLWERKRQIIEQTPGLSVWRGGETFEDIRGVENVKSFMRVVLAGIHPPRVIVFIDEIKKAFAGTGTDLSGVKTEMTATILTYMQDHESDGLVFLGPLGSCKIAMAKATGGTAGIPTIAFDLPAMESSLVGASTERLRTALHIIDAVSQGRMLFIATCDSIASLPPELRRRFTLGTFFFDLPTPEERETIWRIYLKRCGVSGDLPIDEGWTGAEINECCRKAHRLGISHAQASRYIVPISRFAAEQIKTLRQTGSGKFICASMQGVYRYEEETAAAGRRVTRELSGPLTVMPPSKSEA
jgi:hypothetical protein